MISIRWSVVHPFIDVATCIGKILVSQKFNLYTIHTIMQLVWFSFLRQDGSAV